MKNILRFLIPTFLLLTCKFSEAIAQNFNYQSENLIITRISDNVYEHTSFLNTESFGKVPCNGMIITNKNEAVVFDTPADDKTSEELIRFITEKLHCKITGVIPTHFHADCLGGLAVFHQHNTPSYSYIKTIAFAKKKGYEIPQNGFDKTLELRLGDKKVVAEFAGEGHTKDNIIGYFPSENVMFGGCLIKEIRAGKGNLEDANVNDWSATVEKIKQEYPKTKIVIPGHGKYGGTELLDYTIKLFQ